MAAEITTLVSEEYKKANEILASIDNEGRLELPVTFGSLSRIKEHALPNWRVPISGSGNHIEALRALSDYSYRMEWSDQKDNTPPPEWISAIKEATEISGLKGVDIGLNSAIADFVKAAVMSWEETSGTAISRYRILDIGAGTGDTSINVVQRLANAGIMGKIRLKINEPSDKSRHIAEDSLLPYFNKKVAFRPIGGEEKNTLPELRKESMDIVISNAVFHHFSDSSYIQRIARVLKPGGLLIVGDYHTTVWHHPAMVANFLKEIGAKTETIHEFRAHFGLEKDTFMTETLEAINNDLSESQKKANKEMEHYWRALIAQITQKKLKAQPVFEAHESSRQRLDDFKVNGLETNVVEIMKSFYRETVEREVEKLKRSAGYIEAPEDRIEDALSKGELIRRETLSVLKKTPIGELERTRRSIHPQSDIARVIVVQKPLSEKRAP